MAYVRRRLLKDGKTVVYLAMWREHAQGKELSKSFERKADAERHLVDIQHRLLTGAYAPPRLGRTPFSEVGLARTAQSKSGCATRSPTSATGRSRRSARATCSRSISRLPLAPNTVRVVMQIQHAFAAQNTGHIGDARRFVGAAFRRSPIHAVKLSIRFRRELVPLFIPRAARLPSRHA